MSRIRFSWTGLQRETTAFGRQLLNAQQRLAEWRDVEPDHAARDVVFERGKLKLFHYATPSPVRSKVPLLVVYALVNRPYMADLTPTCSLLEELRTRGLDLYLIEWGYPDEAEHGKTLADYICGDLGACVEWIRQSHGCEQIDLLGICQGGTFSLCYAAMSPGNVRRLVTTVTPVDFHTPDDLLSHLARHLDVDALVRVHGNIPGELLNAMFLMQKPHQLMVSKYLDFVANSADADASGLFLAMEKWIFDSPALAGTAFAEFVRDFYQRNALVGGSLVLAGRQVSLDRLKMPILNVFARNDHLVPPASSRALGKAVDGDYTEAELSGGHIGIYVSARTRAALADRIADWIVRPRS